MNKTEMLMFIKYESPTTPLELICEEYFDCAEGTAKLRTKAGVLPIPFFDLAHLKGYLR
jgi:hypothetical protein